MKKRLLSGLMAAVMALSLSVSALAADAQVSEAEAAQVLAALDIMAGDDRGNLRLDAAVTRAEFTKLTVAASTYRDSVGPTASVSPYPDVPKNNWAAPWVQCAKEKGLVRGNLSGYFEPGRTITLAEGVTMALRLLGYQDADFSGAWPSGQMALYRTLKLDRGVSAGQDSPMTRRDAMYLFYNLLTAKMKDGKTVYLTALGHTLTASGEIDRVALINSAMEGPVVAESGWQNTVPFNVSGATVYRGGVLSSLSAIQSLDVVYYSKPMRTLWAWSNKTTGTIQKLSPSASAPTSVTVSGQTYAIETPAAAYDLSDLGPFRVGDSATFLLGRDGGVAAVRTAAQSGSVVYGVVTKLGSGTYTDKDGNSYVSPTVTILATDGGEYSYQWEKAAKQFKVGDLVRAASTDGGFQLKQASSGSLTGAVNAEGTKLGNYTLAGDVEILDTYKDAAPVKTYPGRLAGVEMKDDMVRFYALNERGEIDRLILNDVTGDMHQYGILTGVAETGLANGAMATYTYDVGGAEIPFLSKSAIWNLKKGPCVIKSGAEGVERIYSLAEVSLSSVDGNTALSSNRRYTLSDSVAVYEKKGDEYFYTDLGLVSGGGYALTGYYDKAETAGGRIRVIIAVAE